MNPAELKRIRLRLGLTQEQMAKKLDMSRRSLSRFETSNRKVPRWLALAVLQLVGQ